MRITLIGAGRVATQMGKALRASGHEIAQVYSRSEASAKSLADALHCPFTTDIHSIAPSDTAIFMLTDAALPALIEKICPLLPNETLCIHTAGSMPVTLFEGKTARYGVLYPMQTFTKGRDIDFRQVPCYIEAPEAASLDAIRELAETISDKVRPLSYRDRLYLHLAAVFASNMASHCYHIAHALCQAHGIDFADLAPLINETAAKMNSMSPREAQTGPAARGDHNVVTAQMRLLDAWPETKEIYRLMSAHIEKMLHDDRL